MASISSGIAKIRAHPIVSTSSAVVGQLGALVGLWYLFSGQPPIPTVYSAVANTEVSMTTVVALTLFTILAISVGVGVVVATGAIYSKREADRLAVVANDLQCRVDEGILERDVVRLERDVLRSDLDRKTRELDIMKVSLAESKAEAALAKLERLGRRYVREKWTAKVTVRFIDFSDGVLADRIESLFARYTQWATECIRDDGSKLRSRGTCRVLFESGTPELIRDLAMIFNEGNLLQEPVDCREIIEQDNFNVVITVFPRTTTA